MNTIILKLGGSLLSPSEEIFFDFDYVSKFKNIIKTFKDTKFIIITGGGKAAVKYQQILKDNQINKNDSLDWAGIAVNNLNAQMCRIIFADIADIDILTEEEIEDTSKITIENQVKFAGGSLPGHSGDAVACKLAIRSGALDVYILKNVDGVYSADPKKDITAERLDTLTWQEYFNIIGTSEFVSKIALPIDPIAADLSQKHNLKIHILGGEDLENITKALKKEEFTGTTIS